MITGTDNRAAKVIGMAIWMIPVITLLYNGIARLVNMGADMENLFMAFMYYGTGLLFMVIGNYLPKVKQNNTIGIRVVWTLQDEENWNATHRFSGKLWMASGILCMLCGLFGESMAALVLYIISIMAAAIISILYSYLFYKKKIATGEKLKIQYNKKTIVIYRNHSHFNHYIRYMDVVLWEVLRFVSRIEILLLRHKAGAIIQ